MGGRPVSAVSIVGFPSDTLPLSVLSRILQGANDKVEECGIVIGGGHTIEDAEPKFGLAVAGVVHPDKILRNIGAKDGDVIILTKPIGTGIITTCMKKQFSSESDVKLAVRWMTTLNKVASEVFQEHFEAIHSLTDVTGFGLMGHLHEMMKGSNATAVLGVESIPLMEPSKRLLEKHLGDAMPGGTLNNMLFVLPHTRYHATLSNTLIPYLISDAQTSGGLLACVAGEKAEEIIAGLHDAGLVESVIIGHVVSRVGDVSILVNHGVAKMDVMRTKEEVLTAAAEFHSVPPRDATSLTSFFSKGSVSIDESDAPTSDGGVGKAEINGDQVFLLKSDKLGEDPELGKLLMKGQILLLAKNPVLPHAILFVNTAVFLTTSDDKEIVDAIGTIEERGCSIISCSTCLNFFNIEDRLKVGSTGAAKDVTDALTSGAKIVSMS
jgi:selenide, water dikinase